MAVKKVVEAEVLKLHGEGDGAAYRLTATGGSFGRGQVFTFFGEHEVAALKKAFAEVKVEVPVEKPVRKKPEPKKEEPKPEVVEVKEEAAEEPKPKKKSKKKGD